MTQRRFNATIMRGGTSRGVFLREGDVPVSGREKFLVGLIGSPDPLQVDGLGGGFSSTSKAILVKRNPISKDIEYLFAQVYVDKPKVDYNGNCGNLTAAVGPYAVEEGMMPEAMDQNAKKIDVPLFNINTQKHIVSTFDVANGKPDYRGMNSIQGVPKTGVSVYYKVLDPAGTVVGKEPILEPSLNLNFDGERVEVSVFDITSVYAFVEPPVLGLKGDELPPDVNSNPRVLERVHKLRGAIKKELGKRLPSEPAGEESELSLRLLMVSKMKDYKDWLGNNVKNEDADIMLRAFSLGKMHHSIPFTAALCTAAALKISGSIVSRNAKNVSGGEIRIAHPKGVAKAYADVKDVRGKSTISYVGGYRTSRLLMRGEAFLQE
jgi:2-methylaconitate cis-trans-isomerase PrpF